jgi:hypothetical protein
MASMTPTALAPTHRSRVTPARPAGLMLRVRVLLRRERLDRSLAEGCDPLDSAELALRARQLTGPVHRGRLADSIERIVALAEGGSSRLSSAPPLLTRDVRASRAALLGLSQALREEPYVRATGVALARRLLVDGSGPLYVEAGEDALWLAARAAAAELTGHRTTV